MIKRGSRKVAAYDGGGLRLDPARVLFILRQLVKSTRKFAQVLSASSGKESSSRLYAFTCSSSLRLNHRPI